MKKRVIHAELSKASAEWLTYEVTIQNEKGEVLIPEVLQKYTGFEKM